MKYISREMVWSGLELVPEHLVKGGGWPREQGKLIALVLPT